MACGVVRIDGDARWLMVAQPPVLAVQETTVKLFDGNARGKWVDTSTQQGRVRMHTCGCWCSPTAYDRTTSRDLRGVLQACLRFACTTMPPREACSRLIMPSLPPTTVLGENQRLGRWRHSSLARNLGRVGRSTSALLAPVSHPGLHRFPVRDHRHHGEEQRALHPAVPPASARGGGVAAARGGDAGDGEQRRHVLAVAWLRTRWPRS